MLVLVNRHETFCILINLLFVFGPKFTPYHVYHATRGALSVHKLSQRLNVESTTYYTTNSWEPSIVPASHVTILDEPSEFSLTEDSIDKIHSCKGMDADSSQVKCSQHPLVLFITIVVLCCSECMSDAFKRINDWASQVISRIGLVGRSGAMMWLEILSENDRIAHSSIYTLHINLGTQTPRCTLFGTTAHELKVFHALLWGLVAMLRILSLHTFCLHLFLGSVVHKSHSMFDQNLCIPANGIEIVRRVRDNIGRHTQGRQVLDNG
mmetsp:Transcript_25604/g.46222  ORF Transcript_25604/g.46222 Transcript_25604/m.46222 type:complete len:266 (+) Transcript_25604:1623-2420(+)